MPTGAVFAGKYTFGSTNASGTQYFVTGYVSRTGNPPTPSVSAPTAGPGEALMLYASSTDEYDVSLLVPGSAPGTVDVVWCVGQPEMLFVSTTPDPAQAQAIGITGLSDATSTWSIVDGAGATTALGYIPEASRSPLVYVDGSPGGLLTTFANDLITPGYEAIVTAGAAPQNADFSYTDLAGLNFSGLDLAGADFTGARLIGTNFSGANLTGATFVDALLDGANFSGATLADAVLSGVDLTGVTWGSSLAASGADFSNCTAVGSVLSAGTPGADLSGATFAGADLSRAGLVGANLSSAVMYGANLTGANLSSANLDSSRLGGSGEQAPAVLTYVVLANTSFDQADLFGVDCAFATIFGAETTLDQAATLQQANFSNAYLEGVSFASSNLQGAVFDGACLINVDFTRATLDASDSGLAAASMVATCLQGATFTAATLGQANLANAAIAAADGTLPVRYCSSSGLFPPTTVKPLPMNHSATTALDQTTLAPATICPNGATYAANLAMGLTLTEMLTAAGAPTSWAPAACLIV